ncbi:MAG TPA: DUF1330 domain-containing protein [Gemmatimonadaceae bacterium]
MAAYLIVEILRVRDEELYADYRSRVSSQLRDFGGEYLARGSAIDRLEGTWQPKRIVVVRFESAQAARRWWSSAEYAELKEIRQASTDANMIVVEGISITDRPDS